MIDNKLQFYQTRAGYDAQADAGNIPDDALVFVKDTHEIITHGEEGFGRTNAQIDARITNAISGLDASVSKTAGADGLALSITEVDGKVTAVNGSIAANTYDSYGSANAVKSELKGNATSACDTLGEAEALISAEATRAQAAEADRYTKSETYTKEEVHNLITTPNQEFVTVVATDQTTAATDVLPATGSADTIYRVGNWDGSQYDESLYTEYAWNSSAYIPLSVKSQIGEVYDISLNHAGTTYADLSAALGTNGANVPQSLRKGGMSVKYVQSSDNNYIQARLMANEFTTDINKWQIVDEEPTPGTTNLVRSNGVAKYIENIIGAKYKLFSGVLTSAGIWNALSTDKHIIIPIKAGDSIVIKGTSVQISFLKSYTIPVLYASADYSTAEGFTTRIETNSGTYTCPSDAVFLIVNYSNNGTIRTINQLEVNGEDFLNGIVYTAQKTADDAISELASLYFNLNNGRLGPDRTWINVTSGDYYHVAINIKEGDVVKIKAKANENLGFLKSYTQPTADYQSVDYSTTEGFNGRIQTSDATYTCPSDAKFLVVGYRSILTELNINGKDYLPIILRDIQDSINVNIENTKNINDKQETEYNFVHGIENAVKYNGVLGPNKIWFGLANGRSVVYKVKEGDEVVINTVAKYGFLKSYTQPTADYQSVDYSTTEGYDDRLDGVGTYIVPSDVNYLVVCVTNVEGVVQLPSVFTINGLDMIKSVSKDDYIFPSVRVIQISDTHCDLSRDNQTENGVTNVQRMALVTDMIDDVRKTGQIDIVVCTGDMAMGDRDTLRRNPQGFKEYVIDKLQEPFAPVPGNHDNYTDEEWYNAYGKPRQYSVDIGKWYLIVCDVYGGNSVPNRNKFYGIDTAFLETELSTAKKLKKMPIFCVHTITPGDAEIVIDGMTEEEAAERIASARQSISDAKSLLYQYGCLLYLLGHSHITSNGLGYVQNHWECNPGWFGPINDYTYDTSPWGINLFEKIGNKMTVSSIVLAHNYVDTPRLGNVPASKTTIDLWDDNVGKATYKY